MFLKPLTIFPLSGSRVQVSKQLVCCHSFRVDIAPHGLHLHVCVSSVEGLQDLVNKQYKYMFSQRQISRYQSGYSLTLAVCVWYADSGYKPPDIKSIFDIKCANPTVYDI